MSRTVVVSRSLLVAISILVAVAAAFVAWQWRLTPPRAEAGSDPVQAGVSFVSAFYTVDYRDRQAWLDTLAPLATPEGRSLVEQGIAVVLWPELVQAQTVVAAAQVRAEDQGVAAEGVSQLDGGSAWQARAVAVTLAPEVTWPGMREAHFTAYVLLRAEGGQWKFAMFLSQAQLSELRH
jgi:hypothetical protein